MTIRASIQTILVACLAVSACHCQTDVHQTHLRALRDAKLAKHVFVAGGWTFDYERARQRAGQEDKPILAYFTRSFAP